MQHFISAVIGGLVVGAVLLLARRDVEPPVTSAAPLAPATEQPAAVMTPSLDDLYERVRALETREGSPVARAPVDSMSTTDVLARVRSLEAEVAALRARAGAAAFAPDPTDPTKSPEENARALRDAISALSSIPLNQDYIKATFRIPLVARFLEMAPQDQNARGHLSSLIDDYRVTKQPDKARAAIERFGPSLMNAHDLDMNRLMLVTTDADRVVLARRLTPIAAPNERGWVTMELARGLARTGRGNDAREVIDAWARDLAGTPEEKNWEKDIERMREEIAARQ